MKWDPDPDLFACVKMCLSDMMCLCVCLFEWVPGKWASNQLYLSCPSSPPQKAGIPLFGIPDAADKAHASGSGVAANEGDGEADSS